MAWRDFLFGRPLASSEQSENRIGVLEGLPAFGLDGLSSSAYGPEAALTMLAPLGAIGLGYIGPVTLAIIVLLAVLYFSYRQTIEAYPLNGGSYTVAKENLGLHASLLAAAALMIDYVLTVAVGISAGVAALVSAAPAAHKFTLPLCLTILVVVTLINLRGTKEAGWAFAFPTYLFLLSLGGVIVTGLYRAATQGGHPQPLVAPPPLSAATSAVSLWLLPRAFASGCTAMTGVEAVSNGVSAFRAPTVPTARRTLTVIVVSLAILLGGIAYLAQAYGVGAMDQDQPGYQSVLSQLVAAVAGRGVIYYVTLASILCVLCLSANTSFVAFPRLCRLVASDDFLPRSFATVGRRLVFTVGILFLAGAAGLLLFAFKGITDRLIPLYAVGAFTAFLLSQTGMVVHWRKARRKLNQPLAGQRHAAGKSADGKPAGDKRAGEKSVDPPPSADQPVTRAAALTRAGVNATGAVATGVALAIILAAKFLEGAWITIVAIPLLIILFKSVNRYYRKLARQVEGAGKLELENLRPPVVIVPIRDWDKLAGKSLRLAMWLSPDVIAMHLRNLNAESEHDAPDPIEELWARDVAAPAKAAGLPAPKLQVVSTPYRTFVEPLIDAVAQVEKKFPGRSIAVMIPTLIEKHWWQSLLHTRRAARLRQTLMAREDRRTVVITVPWHIKD